MSETAIGTNQLGAYVLTVGSDQVVKQTTITLGQLQTNGLRVVESGLKPGDKIIVNGLQRAIPGSKVVTSDGNHAHGDSLRAAKGWGARAEAGGRARHEELSPRPLEP